MNHKVVFHHVLIQGHSGGNTHHGIQMLVFSPKDTICCEIGKLIKENPNPNTKTTYFA